MDGCDQGVAMNLTSGNQIKFLAAGREHSHIVTQDTQGGYSFHDHSIMLR